MKVLRNGEDMVIYIRYAEKPDAYILLNNTEEDIDDLAEYLSEKFLSRNLAERPILVNPVYAGGLTSLNCMYFQDFNSFREELNKRIKAKTDSKISQYKYIGYDEEEFRKLQEGDVVVYNVKGKGKRKTVCTSDAFYNMSTIPAGWEVQTEDCTLSADNHIWLVDESSKEENPVSAKEQSRECLNAIYQKSETLPDNFGDEILDEIYDRFTEDGYEITEQTVLEELLWCYMCKMQ